MGTRDRAKGIGRRRRAGHKSATTAVDRRLRRSSESTGGETNRHHSARAIAQGIRPGSPGGARQCRPSLRETSFRGSETRQWSLSLRRPPVAALHRRRRSGPAAGHPSDSPAGPNSFRHWFPAERLSGRSFSRPNRTDPSYRRATISAQRVYAGSDSHRREVSARAAAIARACWASVEVASAPVAPAGAQVQGITRGRGRGASGCRCGISNGNGRDP